MSQHFLPKSLCETAPDIQFCTASTAPVGVVCDSHKALRLVGDLRLDTDPQTGDPAAQAQWLLKCYAQHGPTALDQIEGEFAFAIWDADATSLFLCRDRFGVIPLFYRITDGGICFASNLDALAWGPRPALDTEALVKDLVDLPEYSENTASPQVKRVMPGQWVQWQNGTLDRKVYWSLAAKPPPTSDDTAKTFLQLFQDAVRRRMPIGCQGAALLSGGLDSSSIAVIAARLADTPFDTFSMTFDGRPDVDESPYIDSVANSASGLRAHKLDLSDFPSLAGNPEDAFQAPGQARMAHLFQHIADQGVRVVLDGHGGDEVVWHGQTRLFELAAQGRWLSVLSLLGVQSRLSGESRIEILVLLLRLHEGTQPFGSWPRRLLRRSLPNGQVTRPAWSRLLSQDFQSRMSIEARIKQFGAETPNQKTSDQANHLAALTAPHLPMFFENLYKAASAAGLALRFPFFDRRLVEFCLSLPAAEKLNRLGTRAVLRRAMTGLLPDLVRLRASKVNFSAELARSMTARHDALLTELVDRPSPMLKAALDRPALADTITRLRQNPRSVASDEILFVWRLARWHLIETQRSERAAAP